MTCVCQGETEAFAILRHLGMAIDSIAQTIQDKLVKASKVTLKELVIKKVVLLTNNQSIAKLHVGIEIL